MCGIIGIIHPGQSIAWDIFTGLERLEYRGYDSAGIATLQDGHIHRRRAEGKLRNLRALLQESPLAGEIGIGHTRWATHGAPSEDNAHPHGNDRVVVVHNGIIENAPALREELTRAGFRFTSQTDTETIPLLVTHYLNQGMGPQDAFYQALQRLEGAFALALLMRDAPDTLFVARQGSPLAIGESDGAIYVGSDAIALAPYTRRIRYLQEGDWAVIRVDGADIRTMANVAVERPIKESNYTGALAGKGEYRHYMRKEIDEQPSVAGECLNAYIQPGSPLPILPLPALNAQALTRIHIIACGTSYFAAMVARYWLEAMAHVAVDIDIASEFRYRAPHLGPNSAALFISQSGETADTLAALRLAKKHGIYTIAVVNVPESTMAQEADAVLPIYAGPEIGVASTKAFTAQLLTLGCVTLAIAAARNSDFAAQAPHYVRGLVELPSAMREALEREEELQQLATQLQHARDVIFIGRHTQYPIALEGALKLKEISYIHAEGYAAGELKHGPIALLDEHVPVVVLAPHDALFEKTISNLHEAMARSAPCILFTDQRGAAATADLGVNTVILPTVADWVSPVLYALPLQLLAYHVAVLKGTDVDQPRNLAKSVTVE